MFNTFNQRIPLRWSLVAGLAMVAGMCFQPAAQANEADAKVAIARAEAKIELISRETPAATNNPSFSVAQDKLSQARAAVERNKDQNAEWLANEAELLADVIAGGAQLAELETSHKQISRNVDILENELRK